MNHADRSSNFRTLQAYGTIPLLFRLKSFRYTSSFNILTQLNRSNDNFAKSFPNFPKVPESKNGNTLAARDPRLNFIQEQ